MTRQVVVEYLGKDASLGSTTDGLGGKLKKFGLVAAAGFAGVVAAGKGLYEVGEVFDDMSDTIRVGTGATGKELESLTNSAKKVGTEVPASFRDVGQVIADLNTRLGLTGKPLERLTKQFLEAGRITGEALNVKTFTGAFNAFDVKAAETSKVMDDLFRVSQSTGVGMNELASAVARNAPNLKQFNFSIGESAALIGTLDKAGLDGNKTLATLSRAMVEFAEAGKKPDEALRATVGQIEAFTKAGEDAKAINLAAEVFGTRGASQFVAAIKSGRVNLDDLAAATRGSGDSIMKASRDTADFAEQWQIFKNKALLAVEPVATRLFTALGDGMAWLNQNAGPAIATITDGFRQFAAEVGPAVEQTAAYFSEKLGPVLSAIGGWIQESALPALRDFGAFLREELPPVIARVKEELDGVFSAESAAKVQETLGNIQAIIGAFVDWGQAIWNRWGDQIARVASAAFQIMHDRIAGSLEVIQGIIKVFAGVLTGDWSKAWDGVKQIASGVWTQLRGIVTNGASILRAALEVAWDLIKQGARAAWEGIARLPGLALQGAIGLARAELRALGNVVDAAWEGVKSATRAAWTAMREAVSTQISRTTALARGIPGKITGAIGDLGDLLKDAGRAVIQGLIDGIEEKVESLKSKLGSITKLIPDVKGPLDKDKVLLFPAGVAIMEGLIAGIESKRKPLTDVLAKVTEHFHKMRDALRGVREERNAFAAGFGSFTSSVFGQDFSEAIAAAATPSGPAGAMRTVGGPGKPPPTSASAGIAAMLEYQRAERAKAEQLAEDIKKLISFGISEDLLQQMKDQGESGIANIRMLAQGSAADIAALNAANAGTNAALRAAGLAAGNSVYEDELREAKRDEKLAERLAQKLAEAYRKLRKEDDENTQIVIKLEGRTIQVSLLELKRKNGNLPLGLG